jgi:hypothetical protein
MLLCRKCPVVEIIYQQQPKFVINKQYNTPAWLSGTASHSYDIRYAKIRGSIPRVGKLQYLKFQLFFCLCFLFSNRTEFVYAADRLDFFSLAYHIGEKSLLLLYPGGDLFLHSY